MRWLWIDGLRELVPGERAVATKALSRADDALRAAPGAEHFPHLPAPLVLEGFAQTAGLLVGQLTAFAEDIVLAKVVYARFHGLALPGDELVFTARLERRDAAGAQCAGEVTVSGEPLADLALLFGRLEVPGVEGSVVFDAPMRWLCEQAERLAAGETPA